MQKLKTAYVVVFMALISSFYGCEENKYTGGGTVTGLTGTLVLTNNGVDDLSVTSNDTFTFSTSMKDTSTYLVAVKTQPSGQNCTVAQGTGTISSANITNVSVSCSGSIAPSAVFSYIQHDTIPETGDRATISNGDELTFQDTDVSILPACAASVSFRIANVGEGSLESTSTPVITITEGASTEFSIPALPEFPIPAGSYKDYIINWNKVNCTASAASRVTINTNDPEHPAFSFTVINAYS